MTFWEVKTGIYRNGRRVAFIQSFGETAEDALWNVNSEIGEEASRLDERERNSR